MKINLILSLYLFQIIWCFDEKNYNQETKSKKFNLNNYDNDDLISPIFNESLRFQTINTFTKKLLKKISSQNDNYSNELNKCYQQLSKYIRLIVFANKKRNDEHNNEKSTNTSNLNRKNSNIKNSMVLKAATFLHKELNIYLFVNFEYLELLFLS